MVTITDESEIQRLVTKTVEASKLTKAAEAGDRAISIVTGRTDWIAENVGYDAARNVGALYGAYTILISWDKNEYLDKAKLMFESYQQAVKDFKEMPLPDVEQSPLQLDVATSEYENPYLNPDKPFFMSQY